MDGRNTETGGGQSETGIGPAGAGPEVSGSQTEGVGRVVGPDETAPPDETVTRRDTNGPRDGDDQGRPGRAAEQPATDVSEADREQAAELMSRYGLTPEKVRDAIESFAKQAMGWGPRESKLRPSLYARSGGVPEPAWNLIAKVFGAGERDDPATWTSKQVDDVRTRHRFMGGELTRDELDGESTPVHWFAGVSTAERWQAVVDAKLAERIAELQAPEATAADIERAFDVLHSVFARYMESGMTIPASQTRVDQYFRKPLSSSEEFAEIAARVGYENDRPENWSPERIAETQAWHQAWLDVGQPNVRIEHLARVTSREAWDGIVAAHEDSDSA